MTAPARRWNHNLHYHPLILDAVPDGCQRALDVGCGEGILARDAAAAVGHLLHKATKGYWEISAPIVWPPPETYAGMRRLAAGLLPGVRYRRRLLWRYSLVWTKPAA
jgi:hypothetical protein